MGESIEEASLARWLKAVGEPVRRGEAVADLETAKAVLTLESPANGVILQLCAPQGSRVKSGDLLALIGQPGEELSLAPAGGEPAAQAPAPVEPGAPAGQTQGQRISPAARRLAHELGIDIEQVRPSAPGRRIMTEDVQRAYEEIQQKSALEASQELEAVPFPRKLMELSEARRLTGQRMLASAQQIPQFFVSMQADVTRLLRVRESLNQERASQAEPGLAEARSTKHISLTAMLIYLCGRVLVKNQPFNATCVDGCVWLYENANIAIATATRWGVVAPVIKRVEQLELTQVAIELDDLVDSARSGQLKLEQLQDATFTLSNLGITRVSQFVPLITPPQVAALGVGVAHPVSLPVESGASEGGVRFFQAMTLTLSADHRVVDGFEAARFLEKLCQEIKGFRENG
jgi:pyruvate dehydrogenase E2 component (dihydrolipoamide acetyltransferase)